MEGKLREDNKEKFISKDRVNDSPLERKESSEGSIKPSQVIRRDNSLENEDDQRNCCCLYFCGCCLKKSKKGLKNYILNWKKYLDKNTESTDSFKILTKLWGQKDRDAILDLEKIRINPDQFGKLRNDLEFYIPQLCTFLVFGMNETIDELVAFLCNASLASYCFAHRLIWFMSSFDLDLLEKSYVQKIKGITNLIISQFRSKKENDSLLNFFLPNHTKYLSFLERNSLIFLYRKNINKSTLNDIQLRYWKHIDYMTHKVKEFDEMNELLSDKQKQNLIIKSDLLTGMFNQKSNISEFIDELKQKKEVAINFDELNEFYKNCKIERKYLILKLFPNLKDNFQVISHSDLEVNSKTYNNNLEQNNSIEEPKSQLNSEVKNDSFNAINDGKVQVQDLNLASFESTINFYNSLCSISEEISTSKDVNSSLSYLKSKLIEINMYLPSNVYLPFLEIRNYAVVHISVSETRIFKTKNRAPFLVVLELIRLEELGSEISKAKLKKSDANNKKEKQKSQPKNSFEKNKKGKRSFSSPKTVPKSNSFEERQGKMSSFGSGSESSDLDLMNQSRDSEGSLVDKPYTTRIEESDARISKPIFIKSNEMFGGLISKQTHLIMEVDDEHIITSDKNSKLHVEENHEGSQGSKSVRKANLAKSANSNIVIVDKRNHEDHVDFNEEEVVDAELAERKISTSKKLNRIPEQERLALIKSLKSLFGESTKELETRIKAASPYGSMETFKTFKIIVKSGEDLRQEQFATQLINEFNQIFKAEKVDLRLNKYEIISTGNKVGIIECINNAISIDELHKKTGLSLKEFFDIYYTEGKFSRLSKKDAKSNFVKSFAAYCLVCYFLQIKDRHNANIMINSEGFVSHIDFGFMLSNSPGKGFRFERAPFKITNDILQLMEGVNSSYFKDFRKLLWKGFYACVKHSSKIIILVEMMFCGHGSTMPCFEKSKQNYNKYLLRS